MNRRSFFRADGLRPAWLTACPFFERAMTTLAGDRRILIPAGSRVNKLMTDLGDPV
jgi:hypothetical protein